MSDKANKAVTPPREMKKGAVQPEKPMRLPNVAQPRPVSTTTSTGSTATKQTSVKRS